MCSDCHIVPGSTSSFALLPKGALPTSQSLSSNDDSSQSSGKSSSSSKILKLYSVDPFFPLGTMLTDSPFSKSFVYFIVVISMSGSSPETCPTKINARKKISEKIKLNWNFIF